MKKQGLHFWAYLVYLAAIIVAVDFGFYLFFLKSIMPPLENRSLTPLEKKVGYLTTSTKKSFYRNFPKAKKAGTVRVGCFGDSYTVGDETGPEYSYPDFLQKLFDGNGYNVEVLNFGEGAGGFHQSFILWQEYNRAYALDEVLLGPAGIWPVREKSFNYLLYYSYREREAIRQLYGKEPENKKYFWATTAMRGRFILKDGRPYFLETLGDNAAARVKRYTGFIPAWRYLRYDDNAPLFMAAPLLVLKPTVTIGNPFYYTRDPAELSKIYRALFQEMAHGSRRLTMLLSAWPPVEEFFPFDAANAAFSRIQAELTFPYLGPTIHYSPQGNALIARQFFDFLTGKDKTVYKKLVVSDLARQETGVAALPLSDYTDIALELGGVDIGYFYKFSDKYQVAYDTEIKRPLACQGLLGFSFGSDITDALFIPLDFIPRAGAAVKAHFTTIQGVSEVEIGTVTARNDLAIGIVDCWSDFLKIRKLDMGGSIPGLFLQAHSNPPVKKVSISVDGRTIMISRQRDPYGNFTLVPLYGYPLYVRATGARFVDIDKLPDEGEIFIKLYRSDGSVQKLPFAAYTKEAVTVTFTASRLHHPLSVSAAAE